MQWLLLIGREDMLDLQSSYRYYSVCEEHFSPDSIRLTNRRKRLGPFVSPTLCLPQQKETNERQTLTTYTNTSTQTGKIISCTETRANHNVHINLETDTHTAKHSESSSLPKTIEQGSRAVLDNLSTIYSKNELTNLVKCYEKISDGRTTVNRYESYRHYCLNLYYGSPQGYRLLQSALRLPNLTTMYKHVHITTEINKRLMNSLQIKIENMSGIETSCMVVIDAMPLTPSLKYSEKDDEILGFHEINGTRAPHAAKWAIVAMIHGIFIEWQQPIGYALLSPTAAYSLDTLAQWINELITELCKMALPVRILSSASKMVADYFEERWVSIKAPYFFSQKIKVYYISDPKIFLNALRNDLTLYDIRYYQNRLAKYEHITQFYNKDKNSVYRLAPNLTDSLIYPTDPDKNDTAELFSKSVASGLSAYIDLGEIDKSARDTVELIVKISDLISLFNSSNDINSNKRIFNGDQYHIQSLKQMKILFEGLKLIDPKNKQDLTHKAKFMRGVLININSYSWMSEELGILNRRIPIRTLNQGATENFFEKIRLRSNATKPTVEQFEIAFRQLFILNAIKPLKIHNTQADHVNIIERTKRTIAYQTTEELSKYLHELKDVPYFIKDGIPKSENIMILDRDYNHIDRAERHTLMYVSGYLLKKCKQNHRNCETFKKYADGTSEKITLNNISRYLLYSQKNQICLMAIPCNHFVSIVEILEDVFRKHFKNNFINCRIEQTLYEEMKRVTNRKFEILPCPCFPWNYFVKLFIRLRIAYTINLNNREIGRNQKDFVIPLLLSESNFL